MADVVFVVDNSGSMSEEANAVARDIINWSSKLASSGLDVKFGCVGYSEYGKINGAIDMTTASELSTYLNRSSGTNRTMGFSGSNSTYLSNQAGNYKVNAECGAMGIRFADANFSFRTLATRFYVNFTDEPNQPANNSKYSVEFFNSQSNWNSQQGTIYTVYSGNTNYNWQANYNEKPWLMSDYTGGLTQYTNSSFTGVDLDKLPITGAMVNSYYIYFTDIRDLFDGNPHKIKITIYSPDGSIRAERVFYTTFGLLT